MSKLECANVFFAHDFDTSWLQKCKKALPSPHFTTENRKVGGKEEKPSGVLTLLACTSMSADIRIL